MVNDLTLYGLCTNLIRILKENSTKTQLNEVNYFHGLYQYHPEPIYKSVPN